MELEIIGGGNGLRFCHKLPVAWAPVMISGMSTGETTSSINAIKMR
jgi:hypothetical protein